MSSTYLHAMAGVLDRLRREALAGPCKLDGCGRPASGFIEGWDCRPGGICDHHTPEATRLGYHVHTTKELT
jgi:hypothetical protein